MAQITTVFYIVFLFYSGPCSSENVDETLLTKNLTDLATGLVIQENGLVASASDFQTYLYSQVANFTAFVNAVLEVTQVEAQDILNSLPGGINASVCAYLTTNFVTTVAEIQNNATRCALNVSNIGNDQYKNAISKNIGSQGIANATLAAIDQCPDLMPEICLTGIYQKYLTLIEETGYGELLPNLGYNLFIALKSLLADCVGTTEAKRVLDLAAKYITDYRACLDELIPNSP